MSKGSTKISLVRKNIKISINHPHNIWKMNERNSNMKVAWNRTKIIYITKCHKIIPSYTNNEKEMSRNYEVNKLENNY